MLLSRFLTSSSLRRQGSILENRIKRVESGKGKLSILISRFSILITLTLSACGFQPLYSPSLQTTQDMADVKIAIISDRDGQVLRNHLLDLLNPYGPSGKPRYTLSTKLTTAVREVGVRRDATTSRKELVATATIQLLENKTNKIVLTKTLVSINTYSVKETNYYTNVVTQDYGKEEALHSLAYKIQLALGEYFAQDRSQSSSLQRQGSTKH